MSPPFFFTYNVYSIVMFSVSTIEYVLLVMCSRSIYGLLIVKVWHTGGIIGGFKSFYVSM